MSEENKVNEEVIEEDINEAVENAETDASPEENEAENTTGEEAADVQGEDEPVEEGKDEAKKFFKKKEKKDAKDTKIEELTDQVKRQMAEFENFRKRSDKEKSTMYDMGAKSVVEKVLPVIDNFERGLAAVSEEGKDAFYDGMQLVYKQLLTELDNLGVKPIEALGQPFDPNIHNAVMQVESEEYESGVVAQELQKGYMYKDTVVRYSMVAVTQ